MMESINIIVYDIQFEAISQEEEDYAHPKQHFLPNLIDKNTNILLQIIDDNIQTNECSPPKNIGSSTKIHENHPIENMIGDLNEAVTDQSKEPINNREVIGNMCFISKIEPTNVK